MRRPETEKRAMVLHMSKRTSVSYARRIPTEMFLYLLMMRMAVLYGKSAGMQEKSR